MSNNKKKIIEIFIVIITLISIFLVKNLLSKNTTNYEQLSFNQVVQDKESTTKKIEDKMKVHIIGEVNNPGLIELEAGSRLDDAIALAGGLTQEADMSKINLAYILSDGEKVYIPNVNDEEYEENQMQIQNKKVNINLATAAELQTIPGVGESTANSIVNYRVENRKIYVNRRYSKCFWNRKKQI